MNEVSEALLSQSELTDQAVEEFYFKAWSVVRECAYAFTFAMKDEGVNAFAFYEQFMTEQLNYFSKFARELVSGRQTFDRSVQFRARMYIWSCWYYYCDLELRARMRDGFKFVKVLSLGCENLESDYVSVKQFSIKRILLGKDCFAYQDFKK